MARQLVGTDTSTVAGTATSTPQATPPQKGLLDTLISPFKKTKEYLIDEMPNRAMSTYLAGKVLANYAKSGFKDKTGGLSEWEHNKLGELTKEQTDATKKGVEGVAGISSYFVPGGAGLKGAVAAGALSGGLSGASENLDDIGGIAKGAATGGVLSGGLYVAGKGIQKVGKYLQGNKAEKALAAGESAAATAAGNQVDDVAAKAKKVTKDQIDQYLSPFTIPTKRAKDIKPDKAAEHLIRYGINGNLDELAEASAKVTGDQGAVTKGLRDVIGNKEITVPNIREAVESAVGTNPAISADEQKRVILDAIRTITPGSTPDKMSGLDALDAVRNLQKMASKNYNTSTYLTKNPKGEAFGKAYSAAANALADSIQEVVKPEDLAKVKPDIVKKLMEVSPELANDAAKASSFRELRSIAAPFVKLDEMVNLTRDAQNSGAVKAAGAANKFAQTITNVFHPKEALEGAITKKLASPEINTSLAVGKGAAATTANVAQSARNVLGGGIEKLGNLIENPTVTVKGAQIPLRNVETSLAARSAAQPRIDTTAEETAPPTTPLGQTAGQNNDLTITAQDVAMARLSLPKEQADAIEQAYKVQAGANKPLNAQQQKQQANAQSGLRSLNSMEKILKNDPTVVANVRLTGSVGGIGSNARKYAALSREVKDVYARLRSGAVLNKQELDLYDNQLPSVLDDPETIRVKLALFRNLFNDFASGQRAAPENYVDTTTATEGGQ